MDRDNLVGFVFLGICGVVGGILVYSIMTGERITLNIPPILTIVLVVFFVGAMIYGFFGSGRFRRGADRGTGSQWPDPNSGRKTLWDRVRGR